jgi:hypothetical protein
VRARAPSPGWGPGTATRLQKKADDPHGNNRSSLNPQDGIAIIADGSDSDRRWFETHFGRNHRTRKAVGSERLMVAPKRGFRPMVAVKQLAPGERIRVLFSWRKSAQLLNSEAVAERVFRAASESGPKHVIASAWRPMPR